MKLDLERIAQWTGAEVHGGLSPGPATGYSPGQATGYSIDTRTLAPGDLFFAIRGERFDAHAFVDTAFERGAVAAVVAKAQLANLSALARSRVLLAVNDPLAALQGLAAAVRRSWGGRVIAVTGSAGKTTTKEAIATVLAAQFRVRKSSGNLNNHFGLPLQLLRLEPEDEVAVVEMGMSGAGEIAALCRIAAPDWGVVTNVGTAHAESFPDGIAGIARAKYELVESISLRNFEVRNFAARNFDARDFDVGDIAVPHTRGVVFLNTDDAYVSQFGRDFDGRVIYYGTAPVANVRGDEIREQGAEGTRFHATADIQSAEVRLALLGRHNILNALAAIAVGVEAGIPLGTCARAIATLTAGDQRGELIELRGATVINDCYNSNPEALRSMIGTLAAMPATRRILVAGEMLELGPASSELHAACGRAAAEAGIDIVLGVRGQAAALVDAAREAGHARGTEAIFLPTPEEAGVWLDAHLMPGDAVLLKASRGVRLERALTPLGLVKPAG
ncbi:MAG: UDP-N-acetylmuramoyl-tripeptide--D-alanyl-D-alanine ligase [Acidobacteriaceae bacterium]